MTETLALAVPAAERRRAACGAFFDAEAERIARLCHRMAERFARGGRLVAFGADPVARSDARHVAVEFVHPVIVGKRALPALALCPEGGPLVRQVELLVEARGHRTGLRGRATRGSRRMRCGSLARARLPDDPSPRLATWAPSEEPVATHSPGKDPFIAQELVETLYHVLWELVHVFFEHRGLLAGRAERTVHDAGASSFLYPFLGEQEDDLETVVADVRASVLAKAAEISALRAQTLEEAEGELRAAAAALRSQLERGGRVLALGNGGSATDAMDAVADLRCPPRGGGRGRRST